MNSSNPRITNFISTTKDENNAIKIIADIRQMESPTLHYVLCKYIECNIIKEEPQFLDILFKDHPTIITQMIEWMLTPRFIAKKKKIKSNLDFFPYRCKEFMKENITFYQKLYLFTRINKIPINIWFNFIRKQYYDKQTISTALGYFAEVMIPFAKYQFSTASNIAQIMQLQVTNDRIETINIMKILPKQLIQQLIEYAHYEPIFQFIKTTILVSIQDDNNYQISKNTMLKILLKSQTPNIFLKLSNSFTSNSQEITHKMDLLENVATCLKQLINNIQPTNDMQLRIQSFIALIVESRTIPYAVDQILLSKFCNSANVMTKQDSIANLSSSQEFPAQSALHNVNVLTLSHGGSVPNLKSVNNIPDTEQEDLLQILLKILTYSSQIFTKIPKNLPPLNEKKQEQIDLNQNRPEKYKKFVNIFHEQIQYMLNNIYTLAKLLQLDSQSCASTKPIPFSSGQKIKPITFMRLQFLKLINMCLMLMRSKQSEERLSQKSPLMVKKMSSVNYAPFQINFDKLNLIPIIQKFLNQNRWNNIVHHILQKICNSLIICGYEYLKKNIQKDKNKKLTQSFLAFLVQSFTQRDYIFLNTFKFTTQGNLHSIYNISKDLAYSLNNNNKLLILLSQFQPWKKFIMNDLKLYEQKAFPKCIKPTDQEDFEEQTFLKVDEADSIKRLVQNISKTKKWPTKINTRAKGNSKSGIIVSKNSDQQAQNNQPSSMTRSHGFYFRNKHHTKKSFGLEDMCKKKVDQSIQFTDEHHFEQNMITSDITIRQQMSKSDKKIQQNQIHIIFKGYASSGKGKDEKDQSKNS